MFIWIAYIYGAAFVTSPSPPTNGYRWTVSSGSSGPPPLWPVVVVGWWWFWWWVCGSSSSPPLHCGLWWYVCMYVCMSVCVYVCMCVLESRRRRTKGSVVGEEWCQNAAPLRWYTKNVFAQSKMILSRAWLHDTVSCAAWNDARKGVYLKPFFKTPCSNCYWGWSIPIMLDYRDISLMESVPLMWGPVTASPVGIEPMTIFGGGPPPYNWYPIHNGENSMNSTGWPPNTP